METAILLLIFNRPETTSQVLEQIRQAKPTRLYVAADGPRKSVNADTVKCAQAREVVTKGVDWPCEVKTLFREENLGCGVAVYEAITWFFKQEEQGIILEDDCLVDTSFFPFCKNLLAKYKEEESVMGISASNHQNGKQRGDASYYFSKYHHGWGWASWSRAWDKFSFDLSRWKPEEIEARIKEKMKNREESDYWLSVYENVKQGVTDIWDYQWLISIWMNDGVSITPNQNLVDNIGFGESATHTRASHAMIKGTKRGSLPLIAHPASRSVDEKADWYTFRHHYHVPPRFVNRVRNVGYKIFPESVFVRWRKFKKRLKG